LVKDLFEKAELFLYCDMTFFFNMKVHDDLFVPGGLEKVVNILEGNEYGVVRLNSYGFNKDPVLERPIQPHFINRQCLSSEDFLLTNSYWITFISGNVINKKHINPKFEVEQFFGCYVYFSAVVLSILATFQNHYYFDEHIIAAKTENTGGYGLYEVFGKNLFNITKYFEPYFSKNTIRCFNNSLLQNFFPNFIVKLKVNKNHDFDNESPLKLLFSLFKSYPLYWVLIVPLELLPKNSSEFYLRVFRRVCGKVFI